MMFKSYTFYRFMKKESTKHAISKNYVHFHEEAVSENKRWIRRVRGGFGDIDKHCEFYIFVFMPLARSF